MNNEELSLTKEELITHVLDNTISEDKCEDCESST